MADLCISLIGVFAVTTVPSTKLSRAIAVKVVKAYEWRAVTLKAIGSQESLHPYCQWPRHRRGWSDGEDIFEGWAVLISARAGTGGLQNTGLRNTGLQSKMNAYFLGWPLTDH